MEVDSVITLDDNKKYFILLENEYVEGDYYLAVELDENEKYTNNYSVFQVTRENGEEYVDEVNNPEILSKLLFDYELQYKDLAEEIEDELKMNQETDIEEG